MKSWKKQLKNEFDNAVPALKDEVRNAPIMTRPENEKFEAEKRPVIGRRIGIGAAFGAFALVIAFVCLSAFGVFNSVTPEPNKFVIALEINPAVAFVTDGNGVVINVTALNDDADVILSGESLSTDMKNKRLTEAIVAYTDCAAKLGYLDLTAAKNAVRISGSSGAGEKLTANASESLKNYFRSKGIYAVVVEDFIGVKNLCGRLGVNETDSLDELTESLCNLSELYGARLSEDASSEELKNLYKTYVVGAQTLEIVREELLENISAVISNAQMVQQICLRNYEIMMHKDNPFNPLPVDYWRIKKYPNANYTSEFAALMSETEYLLDEYEKKFGKAIMSLDELKSVADVYSSLSGMNLEEAFSSLSLADFQASTKNYIGILKNIGFDVTALESLLTAPVTEREYIAQLQTLLSELFKSRTEQNKSVYEQPREAISESDYEKFINDIKKEYGSLEAFWNKK